MPTLAAVATDELQVGLGISLDGSRCPRQQRTDRLWPVLGEGYAADDLPKFVTKVVAHTPTSSQVLRQAKVLKGLMNGLSGMHRIPSFVVIHGEAIYLAEQPLEVVAPGECFASKSTDIVAAIERFQALSRPRITVAKVQGVMDVLRLGLPQRLNREELGRLGYIEDVNAID